MKLSVLTIKNTTRKAFSLGEVLVAAFVLTVGLTATTALIASSIGHAYDTRDAVIAAELAQEGVELVRNVRDQNFADEADRAEGTPADEGFVGFSETDKHCRMDVEDTIFTCTASQGNPTSNRYYLTVPNSPSGGDRFTHTGTMSRFARYTYIDYSAANNNARVISYVFWDSRNADTMPSTIHTNGGDTSACTLQDKCIFSEAFLTQWSK